MTPDKLEYLLLPAAYYVMTGSYGDRAGGCDVCREAFMIVDDAIRDPGVLAAVTALEISDDRNEPYRFARRLMADRLNTRGIETGLCGGPYGGVAGLRKIDHMCHAVRSKSCHPVVRQR